MTVPCIFLSKRCRRSRKNTRGAGVNIKKSDWPGARAPVHAGPSAGFPLRLERFAFVGDRSTSPDGACRCGTAMVWANSNCERVISVKTAADAGISNVCVPRAQRVGDERNKPPVASILDRSVPSLGLDLGLKTFAAFSDEALPPIEAERFYRNLEPTLAIARRAGHRNRARAIHAKIANRRKDFLHKLSTRLVNANGAIFVGNVNASALAKTRQAKSVLDAGWSAFRTMLLYKCADAGVWFAEVDEAFSTQTCSVCDSRAGPKGRKDLGIRGWQCTVCGAVHDRNVNAAHNILAAGHRRLAEGILVS